MTATHPPDGVAARPSTLDRFLPVGIGLAMVGGLLLGRLIPDLHTTLERIEVDTVSLPIAIAISIAVVGVNSRQALAGTTGPLIEVPAPVALVYVSPWARRRFHPSATNTSAAHR